MPAPALVSPAMRSGETLLARMSTTTVPVALTPDWSAFSCFPSPFSATSSLLSILDSVAVRPALTACRAAICCCAVSLNASGADAVAAPAAGGETRPSAASSAAAPAVSTVDLDLLERVRRTGALRFSRRVPRLTLTDAGDHRLAPAKYR